MAACLSEEIFVASPCLGTIEHLLLAEQKRKIEDLKTRLKRLEDALAV